MHQNNKKCCIVVKNPQAEHGGQKDTKHNVREPICSYGMEWCSFSQNLCMFDDNVF